MEVIELSVTLGIPEDAWKRYRRLRTKCRAGTLTSEEHAELIALTNRIEIANARRIGYLVEMANQQHISLDKLMDEMGLMPKPFA